jgi:HSP20 family protein
MFAKSLLQRDEAKSPTAQAATTPTAADLHRPSRTPVVSVRETADAVCLDADLPGVKADQLHVSVNEGVLTLHGQVAAAARSGFQPVHREYDEADFRRAFTLPDNVDAGAISATAKNGVVTITLPKAKASQPRRIAVTTG